MEVRNFCNINQRLVLTCSKWISLLSLTISRVSFKCKTVTYDRAICWEKLDKTVCKQHHHQLDRAGNWWWIWSVRRFSLSSLPPEHIREILWIMQHIHSLDFSPRLELKLATQCSVYIWDWLYSFKNMEKVYNYIVKKKLSKFIIK